MARVSVRFDGVSTGARRAAAETRAAVKGVGDQSERESKRINLLGPAVRSSMLAIGAGVGVLGAAAAVGLRQSIKAASDVQEQINKASVVFRGSEQIVLEWSKTTAGALGISQRAALEFAGTFGNMLVPMGFARDEAAKMSTQLVNLASDMASFNNASPEETLEALRAGLAGETEPLRRFGVFLNEARIKQEGLNAGLIQGKEELTSAGKASAIYRIILKDTSDAQGDFAKTSTEAANAERIRKARMEDTAAMIGRVFLPAWKAAQNAINDWLADPRNQRMLQDLAETLRDKVGAALQAIAAFVREHRKEIVNFFRETGEFAGDAAEAIGKVVTQADNVAESVGGWSEVFKFGAIMLGLKRLIGTAAIGTAAGTGLAGGAGAAGLLRRRLLLLSRMGPIGLALYLTLNTDEVEKGIGRLNRVINDLEPLRDVLTTTGLWKESLSHSARRDATTKTPQGMVADPRAGASIGSLQPTGGGGTGGVSFTGGITPPKAHVIAFVKRVSGVYGSALNVSSGVRPGSRVAGSGRPSQHGTGDAADIGPYYGKQLTQIGQAALIAAGMPPDQAYKYGSFVGTVNGVNILFNTMVGGNHFNHVHVGLRSLPAEQKDKPTRVTPPTTPDYTPAATTADTSAIPPGGGGGAAKPAAKPTIDSRDLAAAQGSARFINKHVENIVSPTLRARIRQRGLLIAETLGDVTDPKEFSRAKRNLAALERDFKNAVELTSATRQVRVTARNLGAALGRMPETLQRELRPKMQKLQAELGNVTSQRQLDRIKTDLGKIQAAVTTGIEKMTETVERRRDAFGAAFGKVADKALQIFDAKTEELVRKARARVGGELLGEGDLTPAERALAAFRQQRETAKLAADRAERIAELSLEKAEETEEQKAERLRQLAAYQSEITLDDQEAQLERQAELERRAAEAALAQARERIVDERAILRERFEERYQAIVQAFQNEEITAEEAQHRLLTLLSDPAYAADFKNAGGLIGEAFAKSFTAALSAVEEAVRRLREAINQVADATGSPRTVTSSSGAPRVEQGWERALRLRSEGLNAKYGLAHGGRVPGRYVGREDTVPAMLSPGEYVVDRQLTAQLERLVAGSGAGGQPVVAIFKINDREIARALAQPMADEQARIISYRNDRA